MGGFEITQRTSDGYFDANAPLVQWNSNEQNTRRRMDKFLETETTKEFVLEIAKNNESQSADNQLWSKSTNAKN